MKGKLDTVTMTMFMILYVKAPQIYPGNSQTIPRLLF